MRFVCQNRQSLHYDDVMFLWGQIKLNATQRRMTSVALRAPILYWSQWKKHRKCALKTSDRMEPVIFYNAQKTFVHTGANCVCLVKISGKTKEICLTKELAVPFLSHSHLQTSRSTIEWATWSSRSIGIKMVAALQRCEIYGHVWGRTRVWPRMRSSVISNASSQRALFSGALGKRWKEVCLSFSDLFPHTHATLYGVITHVRVMKYLQAYVKTAYWKGAAVHVKLEFYGTHTRCTVVSWNYVRLSS